MTIISKRQLVGKKRASLLSLFCACAWLVGCGSTHVNISNQMALPVNARIAVGPFANNSGTPLANRQVESMLTGILQTKGFRHVVAYPRQKSCEKLLYCADEALSHAQLLHWARQNHIAYVFTGATNEWGYKVGLDGEPVAGISLALVNTTSGHTDWTAVGSVIGSSRSGLDVVGQKLLNALLVKNIAVY